MDDESTTRKTTARAIAENRRAIAEAKAFIDEHAADLGAVCHHKEFQYWPAAAKRRA